MNIWGQIETLSGRRLATLDQRKPFDVIRATGTRVEVLIHSTGNMRHVSRKAIESGWHYLEREGSLSRDEIQKQGISPRNSSYVTAILAKMPGVTHTLNPLTLRIIRDAALRSSQP